MAPTWDLQHDLTPSNFQSQCPLFGRLPGEIRNDIFSLVLVQYEDQDEGKAYPVDSYWYRPGFRGPRRSSSALLRTCKLAYAEGQKVFLRELEWAFWFNRGPEGRSTSTACRSFFQKLTPDQAQRLEKVRFFTQMYWLEGGHDLRQLLRQPNFRPSTLTVTIRYSDWWNWECNWPLSMREDWLRKFIGSVGLRELKVEYETLSWKKDEMMKIVERNKKIKLALRNDQGYLSAENTALMEWKWVGTSKLAGRTWAHHGTQDTVEYVVVTDTWAYVDGEHGRPDGLAQDGFQARSEDLHRYGVYSEFHEGEDGSEDENEGNEEVEQQGQHDESSQH